MQKTAQQRTRYQSGSVRAFQSANSIAPGQKSRGEKTMRISGNLAKMVLMLLALLLIALAGCGQMAPANLPEADAPAVGEAPATPDSEAAPPVTVPVAQEQTQEDITVRVEQLDLLSQADFGDGRTSDAVKLSVVVTQDADVSLRVYPDGGRLLLNTGEEIATAKGDFHETYDDGSLKRGDLYFPLTLTRPNEIQSLLFVMEGPANQFFAVVGEDFVFEVPVNHPNYQPVDRGELLGRAYEAAQKLTAAPGVAEAFSVSLVEELGAVTLHVMDAVLYKGVTHPFAEFLKVEEPVDFIALTLAIENTGDQMVSFSSARSRLQVNGGEGIMVDHLMSQYLSPVYGPGAIKTGAVFFLIPEGIPPTLETLELVTEKVAPGEAPQAVTLRLPIEE